MGSLLVETEKKRGTEPDFDRRLRQTVDELRELGPRLGEVAKRHGREGSWVIGVVVVCSLAAWWCIAAALLIIGVILILILTS